MAEMIRDADGTCILWGMGVTQNTGGSDTSAAISNLLLATGNYRRPGAGAYPLRGHNNVQGACDMGTLPGWLPGYESTSGDLLLPDRPARPAAGTRDRPAVPAMSAS